LEQIISKCLEKDCDLRYQQASDIRADLQRMKRDLSKAHHHPSIAQGIDTTVPASEIAHVLQVNIVGHSDLPTDQQKSILRQLHTAVRNTAAVKSELIADQLIQLPTRDGMALVFFGDLEAIVRCALELSIAGKETVPPISLRMGVHTGPAYRI